MNIDNNNYKQFTFFILLLVAISTLVTYTLFIIFSGWISTLPPYIQIFIAVPSVPGIYTLLFLSFDKYFWKYKIFKSFGIVISDDLNGKWKGIVKSSYDQFQSEIIAELDITQTATKIKICGIFNQSKSVSVHENFGRSEVDNQIALYYFFRNEPHYNSVSTMAIHEGSTKLFYNPVEDTLTGYYYSGRDRNNHGTIEVKRVKP